MSGFKFHLHFTVIQANIRFKPVRPNASAPQLTITVCPRMETENQHYPQIQISHKLMHNIRSRSKCVVHKRACVSALIHYGWFHSMLCTSFGQSEIILCTKSHIFISFWHRPLRSYTHNILWLFTLHFLLLARINFTVLYSYLVSKSYSVSFESV